MHAHSHASAVVWSHAVAHASTHVPMRMGSKSVHSCILPVLCVSCVVCMWPASRSLHWKRAECGQSVQCASCAQFKFDCVFVLRVARVACAKMVPHASLRCVYGCWCCCRRAPLHALCMHSPILSPACLQARRMWCVAQWSWGAFCMRGACRGTLPTRRMCTVCAAVCGGMCYACLCRFIARPALYATGCAWRNERSALRSTSCVPGATRFPPKAA